MWQDEFTLEINEKKEVIWSFWEDVRNWNKWYTGIEYSYLNGNFDNGTNGSCKISHGNKSMFLLFKLINCDLYKSFIIRIKLLLCNMDIGYEIIENNDKLKIKHSIKMNGPLALYHKKNTGIITFKSLQLSQKK